MQNQEALCGTGWSGKRGAAWEEGPPAPTPPHPITELGNFKFKTSLPGCYAGVFVKVGGQNVLYLAP